MDGMDGSPSHIQVVRPQVALDAAAFNDLQSVCSALSGQPAPLEQVVVLLPFSNYDPNTKMVTVSHHAIQLVPRSALVTPLNGHG